MQTEFSSSSDNPYASPVGIPQTTENAAGPTQEANRTGSLALIFLGFVLLLGGYLTSNIFAISDLYQLGFGPEGEVIPSPFALLFTTPAQQWLFYALAASAAIVGCVLIGSQNGHPMAFVCYILCPLVALVFVIGLPLRMTRKLAVPVAAAYLCIGTCLAGAGLTQLVNLYGQPNPGFAPVMASVLTEAGVALVIGAVLKLWRSGVFFAPAPATHGSMAAARS